MEERRALLLTKVENNEKRSSELSVIEEFLGESTKLWQIAGPVIFTALCQFSIGSFTQTFAGFLGDLELGTVTVANSVISSLPFGIMLGMASALETLCGQAYGAGDLKMLGIYLQRSWICLLITACLLVPVYIYIAPILEFSGSTPEISEAAGKFTFWLIPQLFAYAMNFPGQKFLQAQEKVTVIAWLSFVVLVVHVILSWVFMFKLELGLAGAAFILNVSSWLFVIGQLLYIFITKSDGAWCGFSWLAFTDLWEYVKLSLASAVMLCVEFWYFTILVLIVGRLPNPLVAIDALGICLTLQGWDEMIAVGFGAAISVRISNELGAGDHKQANIATLVVSVTSIAIGVVIFTILLSTKQSFPYLFTASVNVAEETTKMSALLSITVILHSLQPVLSGVVVGAGWQSRFAYINVACYYLFGLPVGILLGFSFELGVMGVWGGMICGVILQTLVLIIVISLTNWKKEADEAGTRVQNWGASIADVINESIVMESEIYDKTIVG